MSDQSIEQLYELIENLTYRVTVLENIVKGHTFDIDQIYNRIAWIVFSLQAYGVKLENGDDWSLLDLTDMLEKLYENTVQEGDTVSGNGIPVNDN